MTGTPSSRRARRAREPSSADISAVNWFPSSNAARAAGVVRCSGGSLLRSLRIASNSGLTSERGQDSRGTRLSPEMAAVRCVPLRTIPTRVRKVPSGSVPVLTIAAMAARWIDPAGSPFISKRASGSGAGMRSLRKTTLRSRSSTEIAAPLSRSPSLLSVRFQTTTDSIGHSPPRSSSHQGFRSFSWVWV